MSNGRHSTQYSYGTSTGTAYFLYRYFKVGDPYTIPVRTYLYRTSTCTVLVQSPTTVPTTRSTCRLYTGTVLVPFVSLFFSPIEVFPYWIVPSRSITWEMGGSQFTKTLCTGLGQTTKNDNGNGSHSRFPGFVTIPCTGSW